MKERKSPLRPIRILALDELQTVTGVGSTQPPTALSSTVPDTGLGSTELTGLAETVPFAARVKIPRK
jgi:hypothetical protein